MGTPLRKIRVMLSSRNLDHIPDGDRAVSLSDVRRKLQKDLQAERFCGQQILEVWINEESGAESGTADAWETCLEKVDEADVVVVIYNGHGGWTRSGAEIGICHAEMDRAFTRNPWKVYLILLSFPSNPKLSLTSPVEVAKRDATNAGFAKYIDTAALYRGPAEDRQSLERSVKLAVAKAVTELVELGKREGRKGRYHLGSPLDWSRLSYADRKKALEETMAGYLTSAAKAQPRPAGLVLALGSSLLFVRVHGVPSGFGVTEARDLVGRPQLLDHESAVTEESRLTGPLHLIGCHKSVTESQVIGFMGHPDLFLVQAPFGFFVADRQTFAQAFFLTNCRDPTATSLSLQRMFDWLEKSGEIPRLERRARSRAAILKATAREIASDETAGAIAGRRKK